MKFPAQEEAESIPLAIAPFSTQHVMAKTHWIAWILLLNLLPPAVAPAQPKNLPDSLRMQLRESAPDTNRIKLLLELGAHYLYKPLELKADLDSALLYLRQAQSLSEMLQTEKWLEKSRWLMSFCYFERGETPEGRQAFYQLLKPIRETGDTGQEASAWMEMGMRLQRNQNTRDEAISYLEQAIVLWRQLGEEEKAITALKEIADLHLNQGKLALSEQELLEVVEQYQAIGYNNLHYTYDLLAAVSTLRGNLNRALFYGLEMIKNMEATGDSTHANTFYYRLARIYEELGQPEKSVEWFTRSFAKSNGTHYGLCLQIVSGMVKLGKSEEALAFVQNTIQASPPALITEKAYVANALGNCYNALGQYGLAEKHYLDMIRYEALLQNQDAYTSIVNKTIGEFYINRQRFQAAEPYLKKILAIPDGIATMQHLKETHLLLFKVDSAAGDYLAAIRHFQRHKLLNDSLFNETKSRQIEELEIQYETKKKEQDIRLLQNESQLQQIRLQKATVAKNLTFGGIAFLLILVGSLYSRFRMKHRINRRLEIQQIEINQANRALQNLLEEKEWLLREIHHRVKNNLQIVMSLLNTQSAYLESGAALSAIRHSQHRIHSISLIHQKLYQSKNVALIDMPAYIRELVEYLQDSFNSGNRIRFDLQIESVELDVTQAVPLGLILNEAISNAIKYAFPDNRQGEISISMLQTEGGPIQLAITDDGVGLPKDLDLHKSNSLGMSLMKGLSKQLGGTFQMEQDKGLAIKIVFAGEQIGKPFAQSMQLT